MADSGYYWNLYWKKRKEVESLKDDIKDIEKIRDSLTDDFYDEIRNVNNELDAMKEDMKKAVRHNATFTAQANGLGNEKEKAVTADSLLGTTIQELNEEISRLTTKKKQVEANRDHYYNEYKQKKEEEKQEFWNKVTGQG